MHSSWYAQGIHSRLLDFNRLTGVLKSFTQESSMYAVVRTGGKQYTVMPMHEFLVEKLDFDPGSVLELTDVLLFSDGNQVEVGRPKLPVVVHCRCVRHEKGEKLRTVKYKRRKNYRRTYGHRQTYTRLLVERFEKRGN